MQEYNVFADFINKFFHLTPQLTPWVQAVVIFTVGAIVISVLLGAVYLITETLSLLMKPFEKNPFEKYSVVDVSGQDTKKPKRQWRDGADQERHERQEHQIADE